MTTTLPSAPSKTVFVQGYAVRLSDTDCGSTLTGNTFDEFVLVDHNRESSPIVARLRCEYNEESTVHKLFVDRNHYVPFVAGDLHLTAAILDTVMRAFTPEHEFYNQIFDDVPELPLQVSA